MARQRSKRDKDYNIKETLGDALYKYVSAYVLIENGYYSQYYHYTINSNQFMGRVALLLGIVPRYEHNVPVNGTLLIDKAYADEFEVVFYELYLKEGMDGIMNFFREHILKYAQTPGRLLNFIREPLYL